MAAKLRPRMEEAFASKLEAILGSINWLRGWKIEQLFGPKDVDCDILAKVPLPRGGEAELHVYCRLEMRPIAFRRMADRVAAQLNQSVSTLPVLALPNVSVRMAELCAEHRWGWYDLAGNYEVDLPGLLHLHHTGTPRVHQEPRKSANLSTPEASRVLRSLMALENLGKRWTQRSLQLDCQPAVSLGLVNKLVKHLHEEAYLEVLPDRGFRVREHAKLLFAWRDAYRFDRHERRNYFTLLRGKAIEGALSKLDVAANGLAAYAAFSAADFQAPHVHQPKTWLFIKKRGIAHFEQLLEAKEVDSGENMIVLIPDDDGVFYLGDRGSSGRPRMACTNLVQTYVDLSHCGGRGEEAAEAILTQRLNSEWKVIGTQ